ncbi:MAG TPA: glycoside hydrolase family 97 N-terminal domain-containing protein, partial [Bacteroidales bacterium]|nr:glycoside hydrolase family 97 N-terminal domain-containing protein [Bacteroidales bacterium]
MKVFANISVLAGWLFLTGYIFLLSSCSDGQNESVSSPDGKITVEFAINSNGQPQYKVDYNDTVVLNESPLGVIRKDADFSTRLSLASVSGTEKVNEDYTMPAGKKGKYSYRANRKIFHLKNSGGHKMDIIFQISNDGVAYRYEFPEKDTSLHHITGERSGFAFPEGTIAFIQQMDASKTGWSKTQPSYEEYYDIGVGIDTLRYHDAGWVLPALFNNGNYWVLISET